MTFLFTDVEGSTRLQQELGDGYREAIAEHERVLLDAASAAGGIVVDRQTESFFVAFARAIDAVVAAVDGAASTHRDCTSANGSTHGTAERRRRPLSRA